jgi:hypothetical protein
MARLENYTNDSVINSADKLIGTDGAQSANNATKNFEVGALKTHVNTDVSITGTGSIDGATLSMPNLPESDPAVAGRLWNDSGTLKVSAG